MKEGDRVIVDFASGSVASAANGKKGTVTRIWKGHNYPIEVQLDASGFSLCFRENELEVLPHEPAPSVQTVYISGAISGRENRNAGRFEQVEGIVRGLGHDVINPLKLDDGTYSLTWEEYMRRDLRTIAERADMVVVFDDWFTSRGAVHEAYFARVVGLPVRALVTDREGSYVVRHRLIELDEIDVLDARELYDTATA